MHGCPVALRETCQALAVLREEGWWETWQSHVVHRDGDESLDPEVYRGIDRSLGHSAMVLPSLNLCVHREPNWTVVRVDVHIVMQADLLLQAHFDMVDRAADMAVLAEDAPVEVDFAPSL